MFFKPYDLIFVITTMVGTIIAVSSNNWFTAWLGLEINLLSVTPLILNKLNPSLSEAAIKYFLTQALASLFMIIASVFILFLNNLWSSELKNLVLSVAVMIKAGMIPFHYWFPQIIKLMSWMQCIIFMTWQKIAPLILISFLENKSLILAAVLSTFFGSLLGLNQNNLKLLMTYSSISHSGWMASSCLMKMNILLFYFLIYSIVSMSIILILNFFKILKTSMIKVIPDNFFSQTLIVNLMSLGGMPPLLGFLVKLSVILMLINSNMTFILTIFIISSLISLFFYTRIVYNSIMLKHKKKLIFSNKSYFILTTFLTLSILLNVAAFAVI